MLGREDEFEAAARATALDLPKGDEVADDRARQSRKRLWPTRYKL